MAPEHPVDRTGFGNFEAKQNQFFPGSERARPGGATPRAQRKVS